MAGLQTNFSRTFLMAIAILASLSAIGYQMWQSNLFSGQAPSSAQAPAAQATPSVTASPNLSAPQQQADQSKTASGTTIDSVTKTDSGTKQAAQPQQQTQPEVKAAATSVTAAETKKDNPSPEFDIVRVEESGEAVVAGRAEPNANIVLLNKGQEIARTKADANGQFVILPPAFPPGEHLLVLGADQNGARRESTQNVTVSVPVKTAPLSKEDAKPIVALSEPDKPTRLLSEAAKPNAPMQQAKLEPQAAAANSGAANPGAANSPAPTAANLLRFRIVEADEKGAFFASGFGPSGGIIRLYLNDALVATVTVGLDQQWSLKIEKGLIKGTYRVRADLIASADGAVVARVEVLFDYTPVIAMAPAEALPLAQAPAQVKPADMAAVAPAAGVQPPAASAIPAPSVAPANAAPTTSGGATTPMPAAPDLANVVVKEIATVTVTRGDNLWRISRKLLGSGMRYTQIYEANTSQIRDPSLIYPNQVLVMPNKLD